jgi:hypothetical protein
MEKKVEENISENQFGFQKNRGTREAILCLRIMIEKSIHVNKTLYVAFVDLEKAMTMWSGTRCLDFWKNLE